MPRKAARKTATAKRASRSSRATTTTKRRTPALKRSQSKVGGSAKAAKSFAGKRDFGVSAKKRSSENRNSDDSQPRAGTESREAGVGGREGGPGSFSGGDVDTDVIGIRSGESIRDDNASAGM